MRYMTGKVKMMAAGIAVGLAGAMLLMGLIAGGRIGAMGIAAVLLLMGLSGLTGWIIGMQMKTKLDRDRIWIQGYREGREAHLVQKKIAVGWIIR